MKDFYKKTNETEKKSPAFSRRRVLGRGLENLFPAEEKTNFSAKHKTQDLFNLSIDLIHPNPQQPRRVFDKEYLKELSQSIKKNGLIQPIVVRKAGLKYEIIAGERRWRAAGLAGLHKVPVRILERDSSFLPLVENLQRQDLNPVELAEGFSKLLQEKHLTQEKLADQLGIARASLANHLRVLKLSSLARKLVLEGQLSFALAKILLQEKDPHSQNKWAKYFAKHKTDARSAQRLLSRSLKKPSKFKKKHKNLKTQALTKIQDLYGIKARVNFKKKGGELCLRFFSEEELNHLMDILIQAHSSSSNIKNT